MHPLVPLTAAAALAGAGCPAPAAPASGPAPAATLESARRRLRESGSAEVVRTTRELVAFQTIAELGPPADNPEFAALAAYLERRAAEHGLDFRIHGPHDAYEVLLRGRSGRRALTIVTHVDVVPAADPPQRLAPGAPVEGWTVPPFEVSERDGFLYGRGVEDDKGPVAAALVALETLAAAGFVPEGDVVLAMGTAEESDWDGMRRYAAEAPAAEHVVSVDARFPVVVAENGFVAWELRAPLAAASPAGPDELVVLHVAGGRSLTRIPDRAELWLGPGPAGLDAALAAARAACAAERAGRDDPDFDAHAVPAERAGRPAVRVEARGRAAHSSEPESAANALWMLAGVAARLPLAPGGARALLAILHESFDGDPYGERLGLARRDPQLGPLVVAPTVLAVEDGTLRLRINMRRPDDAGREAFAAELDAAAARLGAAHPGVVQADERYVGEPYRVPADSALVRTLLEIYRSEAGEPEAQAATVRGGTYARLFPGAVSFGPCAPGVPYGGHAADERIARRQLELTLRGLFEAMVRLAGPDP